MTSWRYSAIILLIVVLTCSCGGGSTVNPDPGSGDNLNPPPVGQWSGTAATGAVESPGLTGIPEIPFESVTTSRVSSTESTTLELLGSQYLQKYHAEVDGTSLVMVAPSEPEEGGYPLAYGLYRFSGLQDTRPEWLNIECMPHLFGQAYYVGVADYTMGDWLWFGPITFPEFQLDLRDLFHHFVSELGNMYFIVACEGGNGATLSKSTLTIASGEGGDDEGLLPGAPHHLLATDGAFEDHVVIEWEPGLGANYYELWRTGSEEGDWAKLAELEELRYEDFEVLPGKLYWYKAFAVNEHGKSGHSNIDEGYAGELGEEPGIPAPFDLVASDGNYPDKVRVEWMFEGEYSYFQLWRKVNEEGHEWHKIADTEAKEHNDFEVEAGVVYVYKARAILEGQESDWSNHDTGYCCEGGEPNPPWELVATDGAFTDKVVIEWGYEGDYSSFELWRRVVEGEHEFALIGTTEGKRYEDFEVDPGVVYAYKARAVVGEQKSDWSNIDHGYAGEGGGFDPPFELVASDGNYPDKIRVEWMFEGDYAYFDLWRKKDAEGHEWQRIATPEAAEYNDFDVLHGYTYLYKVRAIREGQESGWSNIDHGFLGEGEGPEPPFGLVATDGAFLDKVVIEWGHEGDYGYFELWRRIAEGEHEWALLDTLEGKRYEDHEATPGVVYKYKARAILGEQESDWSNIDTGFAGEGGGGPEAPWDLVASDGLYPDKVRVEWMHEGDYAYFQLWRKVNVEASEWHKIADTEAKEYNDFTAAAGTVYLYKARAILEGQESGWSNHDTGFRSEGGGGPETPWDLVATDGTYAEKVVIEWSHEGDYGHFELWRRIAEGEHEWALLTTTEGMHYQDTEVDPGVVYAYKARAVLGEQYSDWSNIDHGHAGEA
jgi:fibronectin type 3 domain-containing protein